MNKAFERILERLDAKKQYFQKFYDADGKTEEDECINKATQLAFDDAKNIVEEVAEEYNDGWIPCSERLPDNDKKQYIVQKTNGFIDILGFTKDAYKLSRYDFAEYKGKKKQLFYDYDSEYGYSELECEAWQPLPEHFKECD